MYKYFVVALMVAAVAAGPAPEMQQKLDCFEHDGDMLSCFAVKAINTINRAARSAELKVINGVSFVRDIPVERSGKSLKTEAELMNELPRDMTDKTVTLAGMLFDSAVSFFKSHSLEIAAPEGAAARTLDQVLSFVPSGSTKLTKSKLRDTLVSLGLKALALVPILYGGLATLVVKALVIGKIALVIAGILAYQKYFAGSKPLSGVLDNTWSGASANVNTNTGYYRSLNDRSGSSQVAYAGQQPETTMS